jgi:hypothetical protein
MYKNNCNIALMTCFGYIHFLFNWCFKLIEDWYLVNRSKIERNEN